MIRSYQSGDEAAIVVLLNRSLPKDPITPFIFLKHVLTDPNFDPEGVLLAEIDGTIVGCVLAVVRKLPLAGVDLEPDDGWITAFFVAPEARGRHISADLLQAADDFFRRRGRKNVYFASYAPHYFLPGIDATTYPEGKRALERAGYSVLYSPVAMDRNLVNYQYPDDVRALEMKRQTEGYVVEPLSYSFVTQVIAFNQNVFNPDWARAVREALAQGAPLSRVLIARRHEQVVGFCTYGAYDGVLERFGPFGVAPELRGTGLGKVLLYRCMESMRADGLHGAWFLWTGEQSPAGHLYLRAGFTVTRRFDVMKKTLIDRYEPAN